MHGLRTGIAEAPLTSGLLSVGRAALFASDALSRALKSGQVRLVDAGPVYGTVGTGTAPGELVPTYLLRAPPRPGRRRRRDQRHHR